MPVLPPHCDERFVISLDHATDDKYYAPPSHGAWLSAPQESRTLTYFSPGLWNGSRLLSRRISGAMYCLSLCKSRQQSY
jgi:hypothetical protein